LQTSTTVLEAQVDWLTCSTHRERAATLFTERTRLLIARERRAGNKTAPFRLGQYLGERCGRVRYGEHDHSAIVALSGDVAALHHDWFAQKADTITRVDLAVTVRTLEYDPGVAERAYTAAVAHRRDYPRAATPTLIQNGNGGSTLYLGKRTSDRFFRIYDKQEEERANDDAEGLERYWNAWRYELESHDGAAKATSATLMLAKDRSVWAADYLARYCSDHGIAPTWPTGSAPTLPSGFRRRSDRESRLDWLTRTVAPTIRWLRENTTEDELMQRIGMRDGDSNQPAR
jgi:DNA relaxase NicK